ncbi:MAG: hypothetical protein QM747_13510 [Nocardioides sp.]
MTFAGREEMQAEHVTGPLREGRDSVDIERRGVGGEDGALLRDLVELLEHFLLHLEILEHRLDDEVGLRRGELERGRDQRGAFRRVLGLHLALGRGAFVELADRAHAAIERLLLGFDQRHRESGVRETHRDAAAHRAGADDADDRDLPLRRLVVSPVTLDAARSAKNAWRNAFDSSLTMSSPKIFCSVAMPASNFCVSAAPTTSTAFNGAASPRATDATPASRTAGTLRLADV